MYYPSSLMAYVCFDTAKPYRKRPTPSGSVLSGWTFTLFTGWDEGGGEILYGTYTVCWPYYTTDLVYIPVLPEVRNIHRAQTSLSYTY